MDLAKFRYYTDWHAHANQRQYEAPADPWRLVHVDPSSIDRYNTELPLNWGLGRIEGGDWDCDERCHPLEETVVFQGLQERFEQGAEWEGTALYQWATDQFDAGETVRGYERLSDFRAVRLPTSTTSFTRSGTTATAPIWTPHTNPRATTIPWRTLTRTTSNHSCSSAELENYC